VPEPLAAERGEYRNVIEELLRMVGADAVVENGIFIEVNSSGSIYELRSSTAQDSCTIRGWMRPVIR
jgi:hypothetical protein